MMLRNQGILRGILIFLSTVLAAQTLVTSAWADGDGFSDADDVSGKLDIRRARIDLSRPDGKITTLSIETYDRWKASYLLDEFDLRVLSADFDSRGTKAVDYLVLVDAVDRNTNACDLYRRRGRVLIESEEATKRSRIVVCSFRWGSIEPTRRIRWRVDSINYGQWDRAPDDGAFRKI